MATGASAKQKCSQRRLVPRIKEDCKDSTAQRFTSTFPFVSALRSKAEQKKKKKKVCVLGLRRLLASVARVTQREMEMFSDVYKLRCLGGKRSRERRGKKEI